MMANPPSATVDTTLGYPVFTSKDTAGTRVTPSGGYVWNSTTGLWVPWPTDANGNPQVAVTGSNVADAQSIPVHSTGINVIEFPIITSSTTITAGSTYTISNLITNAKQQRFAFNSVSNFTLTLKLQPLGTGITVSAVGSTTVNLPSSSAGGTWSDIANVIAPKINALVTNPGGTDVALNRVNMYLFN